MMKDADKTREQLQNELAEARKRIAEFENERSFLRILIDHLPDNLYVKDTEGRFLLNNATSMRLLGTKTQEELFGKTDFDFMPHERAAHYYAKEQEFIQEGKPVIEQEVFRPQRETRQWVSDTRISLRNEQEEIIGFVGIGRDITKRKQAEKTLQESEEKYRLLIENAGEAIFVAQDGKFAFFNPKGLEMTGYSKEELASIAFIELIHPDDREMLVERHLKRLKGEQLPSVYPFRIIDKAGETKWVEINAVRIDWGGKPATLNFLADITERVKAEEALQESHARLAETLTKLKIAQQQIVHQERLRALGEMAGGITHDFNNVLTPIAAYSDLLLRFPEDLDDKQRVTESLQIINTAAQDAANIISRLRGFYRHREENDLFTPVHLNPLVEQCIALTQPKWKDQAQAAGKSIKIATDLQNIVPVAGVESELREVLTNLIFNAVDAIVTHGKITLRTRRDKNYVIVEVVDEGIGMTREVKQRCFDPFFTTKGEAGNGLGLSMIYGIIQRHKGDITVDSTPGVGTTFRTSIPIHQAKLKPSRPVEDVPIQKQHILVVDDDSAICQMMTDLLTVDGHTVETATNGREGLEKFRGGEFDLVITDRAMPEINGDQLVGFIKQLDENVPVMMLTGFGQMMEVDGEHPSGVDIIVPKPVTLTTLRQSLAKMVEA